MGIFKSLLYGEALEETPQVFAEYSETFGKKPAFLTVDLNYKNTLPNEMTPCCVKVQMDVYISEDSPQLISDSEASHVANVRQILSEHIGGKFVGQGIVAATGSTFLMFYLSERNAKNAKKMLAETFMGSFRHVETTVVYDPNGYQYLKYLYPNEVQMKKIDNGKILRSLKSYGDDGSVPRPVKFNIIFSNKNNALSFYGETMAKNFTYIDIVSEEPPEGMVLPRYKLIIEKVIPFNLELLTLIDKYLLDLCKKFDGEYRSLETTVVEP